MGQTATAVPEPAGSASPLDRVMRIFGDVRAGESLSALLMLLNVFLILAGYYVCKTVREPLILIGGGAQVKSYASAGMAIVLMGFIPVYSWFSSRVDRSRLIFAVSLFFAVNLELFWVGAHLGVPYLGVAFFIWVGIFNNAIVAQFWSYGNDLYSQEDGQRLFPVIGIGTTLGSLIGSLAATWLFHSGMKAYTMLHITAVMLLASMSLYWMVERREGRRRLAARTVAPLEAGPNGFALLAASPYLRLICVLLLLLNLVNTTGEYILSRAVTGEAAARLGSPGFNEEAFIGGFYGEYLFAVNVAAAIIQAFVVSRIVRYLGIAGAVLALPIVAMGAYGLVVSGATFAAIRWAKVAENSADYSVMNTARQMLWLPTSREEKYKAKQAADTFVVRVGDVLSAGLVWLGTHEVLLGMRGFATANLVLGALWIAVALMLLREHRRLSAQGAAVAA
jgi:ATP:ADP antiporter, AAA family